MPQKQTAKIGFDNQKYLSAQTKRIIERVERMQGKLYLEFGGKLCFDYHAARVLPGYDPNVKISLLKKLGDKIELVFCVSAKDVQEGKVRGDFGLTYDNVTLKTIDDLKDFGLVVSTVVINMFSGQKKALVLKRCLENLGIKVYTSPVISGYPTDIDRVVSDEGFGQMPVVETAKPIVIMTGAGPGSGKMATCLAQVYHDFKNGRPSGFAKFETFPIWNLPLKHPVNVAYEAATADLGDFNMVDPFHLSACQITAINYNRDVENFGIMIKIIDKIAQPGSLLAGYRSPTDMGVNMAKEGIVDDGCVQRAARQEIIRRWFSYSRESVIGTGSRDAVLRTEKILKENGIELSERKAVEPAREAAKSARERNDGHKGIFCGASIELPDGEVVTGHNSALFHAESAVIVKAIKKLAGLPDEIHLLSPAILSSVGALKAGMGDNESPSLSVEETLIALSISSVSNTVADAGLKMLRRLNGFEMHLTHLPAPGDEAGLRKLKINYTSDCQLTLQNYIG